MWMGFKDFPLSIDESLRQHAAGLRRHPARAANIVSGQRARQEPPRRGHGSSRHGLIEAINDPGHAARSAKRAFDAMMTMRRIDTATIEAARNG